jgi:hypothetical protein
MRIRAGPASDPTLDTEAARIPTPQTAASQSDMRPDNRCRGAHSCGAAEWASDRLAGDDPDET